MSRVIARMTAAFIAALLTAACASIAPRGPLGIVVVTDGGTELSDGATDVPTTLDLHVSAGRALGSDDVSVTLDERALTTNVVGGAVVCLMSRQALGSRHRLVVTIDGNATTYNIAIISAASAMAAVHADGTSTALDLAFSDAPDQSGVAAETQGIAWTWSDPTHARATWVGTGPAHLHLSTALPTARGSHLASDLDLDLSAPPSGMLRRVEVPAPPTNAGASLQRMGFVVGSAASRGSLAAHEGELAIASPTGLLLKSDGTIDGSPIADGSGTRVYPLIQNTFADTAGTDSLLSSPATSAARTASAIIALAHSGGYPGFELDVENIPAESRDGYTAFVQKITQTLHGTAVQLIVDVVPHRLDHINEFSVGYDIAKLSRAADGLVFMAYDQHTAGTDPGPVAGYDWDQELLAGSLPGVDHSKVWLGLPLYARWWQDGNSDANSYAGALSDALTAPGAVVNEDFSAKTPTIRYQSPGQSVATLYFDDAISLAWKASLVVPNGLAGVAAWRLGFEDPAWWGSVPRGEG